MKDILIRNTELVESEFPNIEWDTLQDMVATLIAKKGKKFLDMNEADKFDYLVDNIINMEIN